MMLLCGFVLCLYRDYDSLRVEDVFDNNKLVRRHLVRPFKT